MAKTFKVETSNNGEYRIIGPNEEEGLVFDFGDRASVHTQDGECWEAFISESGEFDGQVYQVAEAGSLNIIGGPEKAELVEDQEFVFEDE